NEQATKVGMLFDLHLNIIKPLAHQPRKTFQTIDSLADSIKENGVIQPIIVTAKKAIVIHYIIAGERRYLESKKDVLTT
ncbi:ParB N-terminal domain-containing protein, partial [Francisella tularensis]|uniref:ParB N-terminal domain-containing protein n=1 Tax=Francisella tularensis TaxID=263 RepID=UPI002381BE18